MPFPMDAPKKIRDRVAASVLPLDRPVKMWAGYGQGLPCSGCDELILPAQVEYEFPAVDDRIIRFHLGCAGLWEAERRRRGMLLAPKESTINPPAVGPPPLDSPPSSSSAPAAARLWRCPRCCATILTREAGARCPRCTFREET